MPTAAVKPDGAVWLAEWRPTSFQIAFCWVPESARVALAADILPAWFAIAIWLALAAPTPDSASNAAIASGRVFREGLLVADASPVSVQPAARRRVSSNSSTGARACLTSHSPCGHLDHASETGAIWCARYAVHARPSC